MDVMVIDTEFKMVGIIDAYISLIWTDRYDEAGDFELILPMDIPVLSVIKEDYYLAVDESEHWMVIENMNITTDVEEGKRMKITGHSLEKILDRRIIWNKTVFKKTYADDNDTVGETPSLQDAMKQMLNENVISPAMSAREIPNFVFDESTDEAITKLTIEAQYRGENIYDIVSTQCKENQIGFKVIPELRWIRRKSLIPFPYPYKDKTSVELNGVTFTWDENGVITANGTANARIYFNVASHSIDIGSTGKTYTLSGCPAGGSASTYSLYCYEDSTVTPTYTDTGDGVSFIPKKTIGIMIGVQDGTVCENLIFKPRLEEGTASTNYGETTTCFIFKLYAGADRTYDQIKNPYVVFSPDNDNLFNSSYYRAKSAYKNVALVSGDDSEDESKQAYQQPVQVGNAIGIDRREIFVDGSDISITEDDDTTLTPTQYAAHQKQKGIDTLIDHLEYEAFEGEVEATIMYKYGEDFFMGDYVQLEDEYGHQGQAYISEFIISQDASGISMYPTFITLQEGDYDTYE